MQISRTVLANITEVTIRLVAHHIVEGRYQQAAAATHTAPAVRFKGLDQQRHAEAGTSETLQVQIKFRFARSIRFQLTQLQGLTGKLVLFVLLPIVENESCILRKLEVHWRKIHLRLHPPICRSKTKQSLHRGSAAHIIALHPPSACSGVEFSRQLHAVWLKVFHSKAGASQKLPPLLVIFILRLDQIHSCLIGARRIVFVRLAIPGDITFLTEDKPLVGHFNIARIQHHYFDRHSVQLSSPVPLPNDARKVHHIAWAIHTALREQIGIQRLPSRCQNAIRIEPGKVQQTIRTFGREERQIVSESGDQGHRLLFVFQMFHRFELHMTFSVGKLCIEKFPVLCQDLHLHTCDRFATLDGLHEQVHRLIRRGFH